MKTILIVEDDRIYARTTANWLVKNGMDARYVMSVDSAKEFLSSNEVNLVLSDFRLGESNGVELLEWMRMQGYRMPFLIMTGYGDIPGAVEAVKKGADNYLPKPVQTKKVLDMIAGLLKGQEENTGNGWIYYRGTSPLAVKLQEYIRLVAATNEDLEKAIAESRFREDLFHRLNEFPLYVPLLAECPEDIMPLAEFMLEAANRELKKDVKGFDRETQKRLKAYPWPGNIRELKGTIKRAALLAKGDWIVSEDVDLPDSLRRTEGYALNDERTERENIVKALEATGGDKKAAARLLGISRSTLYLKMEKYRLK